MIDNQDVKKEFEKVMVTANSSKLGPYGDEEPISQIFWYNDDRPFFIRGGCTVYYLDSQFKIFCLGYIAALEKKTEIKK